MMAAKGAVYPVEQVMKDAGETFNKSIGTDKLTSEGGLGCHIEWCFGMDTGLETPH
jgi:hypothetical protein